MANHADESQAVAADAIGYAASAVFPLRSELPDYQRAGALAQLAIANSTFALASYARDIAHWLERISERQDETGAEIAKSLELISEIMDAQSDG